MIRRKVLPDLIEILYHFPVLGIVGPRQCGKTTIARQLMNSVSGMRFVYLDLENSKDQAITTLFFKLQKETGKVTEIIHS